MGEDGDGTGAATVVELLDDEYARAILAETSVEPMSATELAERCGASNPTIYRRIERLRELDLLAERQVLDPDGHHYSEYKARLDRVTVDLEEGAFEVHVARTEEDAVDRFTRLYEGLR